MGTASGRVIDMTEAELVAEINRQLEAAGSTDRATPSLQEQVLEAVRAEFERTNNLVRFKDLLDLTGCENNSLACVLWKLVARGSLVGSKRHGYVPKVV